MARTIRTVLNEGNPNKVASAMQAMRFGEAMGLVPRTFRGTVTSNVLVLPPEAKAVVVLSCFVSAGTVNGAFSPSYDPDGVPLPMRSPRPR